MQLIMCLVTYGLRLIAFFDMVRQKALFEAVVDMCRRKAVLEEIQMVRLFIQFNARALWQAMYCSMFERCALCMSLIRALDS
jgi:hypothetical protein